MLKLLSMLMGTASVSVLTMGVALSSQQNPLGGQPNQEGNGLEAGVGEEGGEQGGQAGNQPAEVVPQAADKVATENLTEPEVVQTPVIPAPVIPTPVTEPMPQAATILQEAVPTPQAAPILQEAAPTPQAAPILQEAPQAEPILQEAAPTPQAVSAVPQSVTTPPPAAATITATQQEPRRVSQPRQIPREYAGKSAEEIELDRELARSYEQALSRVKNPSACSTRSDCIEASKRILKNIIDSYGARSSGLWGNDYNSNKAIPKNPNKNDVMDEVRSNPYKYINNINPDDYKKYNNTNSKDLLEKYTVIELNKRLGKYESELTNWVRSNTKKLVENLQKYFEEVNKKSKNPTQKYIYEALSDKTDFNNHVVISDPFKVQIKMEDPKESKLKGKKDKNDDPWAMIGAGIMGTILGGILAPSTPPPAQPQPRPGNNPPYGGTNPQRGSSGYQKSSPYGSSPYGSGSSSASRGAQKSPPYGSGSTSRGAQKSSPYGSNPSSSSPYGSSSGSTSRGTQKPSPYGSSSGKSSYGYQNQSYSFDLSGNTPNQAVFLQPIRYPYDSYSSGSGSSYDSTYGSSSYGSSSYGSSSYGYSSNTSQKSDILGPKNYVFKEGDILIYLYVKIGEAHKSCSDHDSCYKNDIKIIDDLVNHLNQKNDALRNKLIGIRNKVEDNDKESFISPEEVLALLKDDKKNLDFAKMSDLANGNYPDYIKNKATVEWEATLKSSGRASKAPVFQEAKITNEADLKTAYTKKVQEERAKAERAKQKQKQSSSQKGYQQQRPQQQQKDGGGLLDKIFGMFGK